MCESLATILDADAFLTVPINYQLEAKGRLFLTARRRFTVADVQFLLQVISQLMPVLENIRLVDHMASEAAEIERRRIALDIHDNLIQPYVGLQLGLTSVHRKLIVGDASAVSDVERLNNLTTMGISDLRSYISALRDGFERDGNLLPAIKRFAAKFTEATQIEVLVDANQTASVIGQIPDRLAAAVFQIVVEALGNVRRHTRATQATVSLAHKSGHLIVRIENEAEKSLPPAPFIPRSIAERAATLGGHVNVEPRENDRTVINVEIPL